MKTDEVTIKLFEAFRKTAIKAGILHIEYLQSHQDDSLHSSVLYDNGFSPLDHNAVFEQNPDKTGSAKNTKSSGPGGQDVFITIIPITGSQNADGHLILQGSSPTPADTEDQLNFLAATVSIAVQLSAKSGNEGNEGDKGNDRYRRELINLREMQAQLYPRFEDIKGLDIASAFLPAELMGGNFVDGFFVDERTYQIVVCDIAGYDASSSFTGAAVRTILRSETTKKITPSQYIELTINRLKKIKPGLQSLIDLTIYQIDTKTGTTSLSSFGKVNTFFYNYKKQKYVNLAHTNAGKLFEKKTFFKDITLSLESGDGILFYSKGLINAPAPGETDIYGEDRLALNFLKEQDASPVDLIHSTVESVYEFTDYAPLKNDIILIYIKIKKDV